MERDAALDEFDSVRDRFLAELEKIPGEALAFLKPGDDYALGGLLPHMSWAIVHYQRCLDLIGDGAPGPARLVDPAEELEATGAAARAGLRPEQRDAAVGELKEHHLRLVKRLRGLPAAQWDRKTPVLYGPAATDPYPTSPSDIAGWLTDHYKEHIPHLAELHAAWKASA